MWPEAYEQTMVESEQIDELLATYAPVVAKVAQSPPDFVETAALATMLHSFYTGVENIFKRIALEIEGSLPSGPFWHSKLLNAMAQPTEIRPAVISETLRIRIKEYLNFRHVFRQAYSSNLHWAKMSSLVVNCESAWHQLQAELELFFNPS